MRRLILGTAGHIDHGKTALVKALTGIDTDRLKEEKERGITVDLGFAEYQPREGVRFGVVDVPGHEGFIRNMLAGATGMDVVLLVVAADEGVMPQTREHLAIVRLLDVPQIAVAISKSDLVEPEWLDLVKDEVRELLATTPYAGAPMVAVSAETREGLEELGEVLAGLGWAADEKRHDDVVRMPVDRVFTIRGAGTVVTGTLWTGRLQEGTRVQLIPGNQEARVRSLQVHGEGVQEAVAGARVAVGLTGQKIGHRELFRGQTLVQGESWEASWMLTCRVALLPGTGWALEQGQRIRVHLGTSEVLARAAVFGAHRLEGGQEGWIQLRLEEPILARVRDHLVLRSYSPLTTIGGGRVAEVTPRKRRSLQPGEEALLEARLMGSSARALGSALGMASWRGVLPSSLPHQTGLSPVEIEEGLRELERTVEVFHVEHRLFSGSVWEAGKSRILRVLRDFHRAHPLRSGMAMEELRQTLPGSHGAKLAEAILQSLVADGQLSSSQATASLSDFRPTLSGKETALRQRLRDLLAGSGLTPPSMKELVEEMGGEGNVEGILRLMEQDGEVLHLDGEFFFHRESVLQAGLKVIRELAGRKELGPADFREALPLSRKHLLPILRHFDLAGVTTRIGDGRSVAEQAPAGWGTPREGGK